MVIETTNLGFYLPKFVQKFPEHFLIRYVKWDPSFLISKTNFVEHKQKLHRSKTEKNFEWNIRNWLRKIGPFWIVRQQKSRGQFHESKVRSKIPPGGIPLNLHRLFSSFFRAQCMFTFKFWRINYSEAEQNLLRGRQKGGSLNWS